MSNFLEFGFGNNDEKVGAKNRRFKAKDGETYRLSFIWWPGLEEGAPNLDASTPKFIGCKRLYIQGVGYFMDKGPEYVKLAGSPSKMYAGTIVCQWPTNSQGKLDAARFQSGDFDVLSWVMSTDKYRAIGSSHDQFPLGKHDLTLKCTDAQYQKLTILPCRENLFRELLEKFPEKAKRIMSEALELASELPRDIAQDLTLDQIREKLGAGGGSSIASGGAPVSNQSADFDGMLDNLLK